MDSGMLGVAITVVINVLCMGFFYGRTVAELKALSEELKGHAERAKVVDADHSTLLRDHSHRITRLETKVLG